MRVALITLIAGFGVLFPSRILAQATITGTVIDTTSGKAISGAEVFFRLAPTGQKTGKDGRFEVTARGVSDSIVIVRRERYIPALAAVDGSSTGVDLGTLYLRPIKNDADRLAADEFEVRLYPSLEAFYRRRREISQAIFLTGEEIARSGGSTVDEVLRRYSQLRNVCIPAVGGDFGCGGAQSKRGTTYSGFRAGESSQGQTSLSCPSEVYVDGRRFENSLGGLHAENVLAIEVYTRATLTPLEFKEKCGAIVVWTAVRGR